MRAIIAGGGIAGLVAAAALQRAGWEPVVLEAREAGAADEGLFLGLAVNGMRLLNDLTLLEPVLGEDPIPTPVMTFFSTTGKALGKVSHGWLDGRIPSITIMRSALQRVLLREVRRRGIEVRHGIRFTGYEQHGATVVGCFEEGAGGGGNPLVIEGDVLIGADGLRSKVREAMQIAAPPPRYTGLLNLGGVAPQSGLPPTLEEVRAIWGRRAFFGYTVRPNGMGWWFANVGASEPGRRGLEAVHTIEWKRKLLGIFADDPSEVRKLITATDIIGAYPIHDMPALRTWRKGRTVLIGDAAHATSPSSGQGASLAMEDAAMIGKCLRDISAPELALERFEALRRPRAERIVAVGRRRGAYKAPGNRISLFFRDLLMPVLLPLFAREKAMSWLYDYRIAWDEPLEPADAAAGRALPAPSHSGRAA